MEDPQKSKMSQIVSSFEGVEGNQVAQLEDKVAELAYFARELKQKRDFLESFAYVPSLQLLFVVMTHGLVRIHKCLFRIG